MPVVQRIPKERRGDWGPEHRKELEHGGPCIAGRPSGFFKPDGTPDLENIKLAWEHFRDEIMAEWSTPGRRPAGWWWFESAERRNRDEDEAQQLERLGELSEAELFALGDVARLENEKLHASYYSSDSPFRRAWPFWRFLHRRDSSVSEAEQLIQLDELNTVERAIQANPSAALAGMLGCRSRFYYLSESEMRLLKLPHKSL